MTLNELMLEQDIEARQLRLAGIERDAPGQIATSPAGIRSAIAALLVRLGTRLDRRSAELVVLSIQPLSQQEVHHAL